jgi:ABC-type multidrug transport system fused ATPase/permease subunit
VANLTVRTFGAEAREQDIFRLHSGQALDLVRSSQDATNRFTMNTMLLRDIGRTIIYFLGCALVLRDEASYGDVIAFTTYSMQLLAPAVRFSSIAQQMQDVKISVDRIFELFDEQPEIRADTGAVVPRARGDVEFDHVDFWYEPEAPVLRDISFRVAPGETIALVGPTGCGKSTILSLLLRFFDVKGGAIRLDGKDVRATDVHSLRRQFGIVLQESLLFNVSIADNIRYSKATAGMEEIVHAARIAEIHDVIEALPQGYASLVGGRDVQLSVGQKQRLSIARAVLADPAVLIMDEATSALDSESERAVQAAMDRFLVGRTSFIVAHRLSTVRNADRIILLDKGVIQEMGSHDELMRIPGGRYHGLYDKHSGKGIIRDD